MASGLFTVCKKTRYTVPLMPKRKLKLPPLKLLSDETFGQRLARLRKERGYTQVELAAKVGIIQGLVTDYERDKIRLNAEMICRFTKILDVTSDEFLGLADPKSSASKKPGTLSLKIVRRLQRIEKLPAPKQRALLQSLDLLLGGSVP